MLHLQVLDRLNDPRRDEGQLLVDTCQRLHRVEQAGGRSAQQGGGLSGDDTAVIQLQSYRRRPGLFRLAQRRRHHRPVLRGQPQGVHDQLDLPYLVGVGVTPAHAAGRRVVAPQNLLPGGFHTHRVVADAEAQHIYAHVRGALVGAVPVDPLENSLQHREDLHIPVVVDGGFAVGLQMEGVDHVHVVQIRRGRLVSQVHRVLQGQVPHREGLKLGVAGADAPLVLVVKLAQTGGHLAAAGAGGRHHHQAPLRLDIVVPSEALLRHDQRHVGGIVRDDIVLVHPDAQHLQPLLELVGHGLAPVMGDHHAADVQPDAPERVDQPQGVLVIGDAQVPPALVALDVVGGYGDDDLRLVLHFQQHGYLAVRLEPGHHPGCVEVVKQLPTEFQVQLSAEFVDSVPDVLRLQLQVFVVVKAYFVHGSPWPPSLFFPKRKSIIKSCQRQRPDAPPCQKIPRLTEEPGKTPYFSSS